MQLAQIEQITEKLPELQLPEIPQEAKDILAQAKTIFGKVSDWASQNQTIFILASGVALNQYVASRGKRWVPLAVAGAVAINIWRETKPTPVVV